MKRSFEVWPRTFDCVRQYFLLQIKQGLDHEEPALVCELAVEEEFELCAKLARSHAENAVLLGLSFNGLNCKVGIGLQRFCDRLASTSDWQLHP